MRARARTADGLALRWLMALAGCAENRGSTRFCGSPPREVDILGDPRNCGSCGFSCGLGAACVEGRCACSAPGHTSECGDCRNLSSDETSCGACNHACAPGESCREGACRCLRDDLMTNPAHCGGCGNRCGPEQVCVGGRCGCESPRESPCEDSCHDIATDPANCGGCGVRCPEGTLGCAGGRCRCPGATEAVCGESCVDVATSLAHCGACGRACAEGARCVTGSCVPRSVAPLPGAIVAAARPTFRCSGVGMTPPRLQVCAERACERVVAQFGVTSTGVRAPSPLTPGVYFWRVGDAATGVYGASWPFAVTRSEATSGTVVGALSDVTADGVGDLLVGAPAARVVRVFAGRSGMAPESIADLTDTDQDGFGLHIALAGDVDGDGRVGFAVGAHPRGGTSYQRHFQVDAMGAASELQRLPASSGPAAGVGDINGDGYADFVAGDPASSTLVLARGGADGAVVSTMRRQDVTGFAASVAAAWDVDADYFADVLVGAPDSDMGRGAAYLYHGTTAGLGDSEMLARPGGVTRFGEEVAGAGDVDGDGNADLLVGTRGPRAFVYLGGTQPGALPVGIGASTGPDVRAVAAGDVDCDGYADVLIPQPAAGRADLYRGGPGGIATRPVALTDAAWAQATGPVAGAGDLDGDGCAEVAVGVGAMRLVQVFFGDAARPLVRSTAVTGDGREGFGDALGR